MSPALLNKYLEAARKVADHMVLTPDGFDFAPHPMLVETDRDRYAIKRILDFYANQPTDYADYFNAAWHYKHRAALRKAGATLESAAVEAHVSAKYLRTVWQLLEERSDASAVGPVAKLQALWRALPAPTAKQQDAPRTQTVEMRDFVIKIRSHTAMQFAAPVVRGLPAGSQPLLNWKLRNFNLHRNEFDPAALRNDTDPPMIAPPIPRYPGLHQEAAPRWAAIVANGRAADPDLVVPAAERSRYEASFVRFAAVFPDTFYVSERGRYFPDDSDDKGRFLSAGYHNVMGFWRDDVPLMQLILDEKGQKQLNRLWDEFDFSAAHTARTWDQFYFNQSGAVDGKGAEAGRLRPPDKAVTDAAVILGLMDDFVAKALADPRNDPVAPEAIRYHFQSHQRHAALSGTYACRSRAAPPGGTSSICGTRLSQTAIETGTRRHSDLLRHVAEQGRADARGSHARVHRQRVDVAEILLSHRPDRQPTGQDTNFDAVSSAIRLCCRKQAELFPVGQYAGRRTARDCRVRQTAET
jgi:hypothetical protein